MALCYGSYGSLFPLWIRARRRLGLRGLLPRDVGPAPQAPAWQAPQYEPQPQYAPAPAQGGYQVDAGINLLELDWARTRVTWVWLLIGAIGALSVGSYWVLTHHPEYVGQLLLSFLPQPSGSSAEDQKTAFDILQIVIGVVLSWLPFTGLTLHGMTLTAQSSFSQLTDVSPLMWQGLVYLGLAALIWRKSVVALALASLFLADSGILAYGIFKLFQLLWEQYQKYQELTQEYPSLATGNGSHDIGSWPWILVIPIVVRLALLWFLVTSFSAVSTLKLHHRRLKAAKADAQALAA